MPGIFCCLTPDASGKIERITTRLDLQGKVARRAYCVTQDYARSCSNLIDKLTISSNLWFLALIWMCHARAMSQHAKNVHSKQITLFSRSKSDSKKSGRTDGRTDARTDKHTSEFWGLYTIGPSGKKWFLNRLDFTHSKRNRNTIRTSSHASLTLQGYRRETEH